MTDKIDTVERINEIADALPMGQAWPIRLAAAELTRLRAEVARLETEKAEAEATITICRDALLDAKAGLDWYQGQFPEVVEGSDDVTMERIETAIVAITRGDRG